MERNKKSRKASFTRLLHSPSSMNSFYNGEAMKNIAIANEKNPDFLTDQI